MLLKRLFWLLLLVLSDPLIAQQVNVIDFAHHFQKYGVEGSFVLYDAQDKNYTVYDQQRNGQGFIPASTFKIPNSLIALELGIMEDENTLIKWDGTERSIAAWNKDMNFATALRVSCVPCYQQIARRVGVERYHKMLNKLDYGNMDVNAQNLDQFWLRGNSRISPLEQVDFLKQLYKNELEVSQRSMDIVKSMLVLEEKEGYVLRGKTGWAIDGEYNVGWFVGWIEKGGKPYFFATNVGATNPDEAKFIQSRIGITKAILKELGLYD